MIASKSIEFSMESADVLLPSVARRNRRAWFRWSLAPIVLMTVYVAWMRGFSPLLIFALIFVALEFAFPPLFARLLTFICLRRHSPKIKMTWDEERITVDVGGHAQDNNWNLLAKFGSAVEYDDAIVITSGRGNPIPFPKRVFDSALEWNEFRCFVAEKMGNRFRPIEVP